MTYDECMHHEVGFFLLAGDLPKQVKIKKLAKLKTLDTKPGTQEIALVCLMQNCIFEICSVF